MELVSTAFATCKDQTQRTLKKKQYSRNTTSFFMTDNRVKRWGICWKRWDIKVILWDLELKGGFIKTKGKSMGCMCKKKNVIWRSIYNQRINPGINRFYKEGLPVHLMNLRKIDFPSRFNNIQVIQSLMTITTSIVDNNTMIKNNL